HARRGGRAGLERNRRARLPHRALGAGGTWRGARRQDEPNGLHADWRRAVTHRREHPSPVRFGTDGWRAPIAEEFTFENVERIAQAYADFVKQQAQSAQAEARKRPQPRKSSPRARDDEASARTAAAHPHVVVGYDRRFLSERFAERAAEVFAGNALEVSLFDTDVPTPLVSWAVRERVAAGGVVITASHNPPHFNGFKIKAPWGGSATAETTVAVESLLDASAPQLASLSEGARGGLDAQVQSYRAQVAAYVDLDSIRAKRARVVVDSMHGSGGRWVESFLKGGRLAAETIRSERDAFFGGVAPEPIDRNLAALKERVRERRALV